MYRIKFLTFVICTNLFANDPCKKDQVKVGEIISASGAVTHTVCLNKDFTNQAGPSTVEETIKSTIKDSGKIGDGIEDIGIEINPSTNPSNPLSNPGG